MTPCSSCFSTDTSWFSGPRGEVAVAWRALVGGLTGAAALRLLALSIFVARYSTAGRGGGGERVGGGREGGKGVPAGAVLLCQRVAPTQVLGRRRMCDEDTVGTFSDLGLEDERTGESCLPGRGAEASLGATAGLGRTQLTTSLARGRHGPPSGKLE